LTDSPDLVLASCGEFPADGEIISGSPFPVVMLSSHRDANRKLRRPEAVVTSGTVS
jgi:hypothetical protein